jgi:AraC-like DNA-binding protein
MSEAAEERQEVEKIYFSTDDVELWKKELYRSLGYRVQSVRQDAPYFYGSILCARFSEVRLAIIRISPFALKGVIDAGDSPFYEFQLVDKGFGRIHQGGTVVRAAPGRMICFDSEKSFDLTCTGDEFRLLIIRIPKKDLAGVLGRYPTLTTKLISEKSGLGEVASLYISAMSRVFGDLSNEEEMLAIQSMSALVKALLVQLQSGKYSASSSALYNRALQTIEDSLEDEDLSVAKIAEKVGISKSYLASVFRSEGKSVMTTVKEIRLQKSRSLLIEEPASSVTDISVQCGFSCPSVFNHSFKKEFGLSPSEYRAKMMQPKPSLPQEKVGRAGKEEVLQ